MHYTPAPWHISDNKRTLYVSNAGEKMFIASIDPHSEINDKEKHANLVLISRAPELVEILEAMVCIIEPLNDSQRFIHSAALRLIKDVRNI